MEPGRFLSLSVLALGVVTFVHAGLEGLVFGDASSAQLLAVMGLLWCGVAGYRLRGRDGEATPEEYGIWTYGVVLLVGGYLGYLSFTTTLHLF